VYEQKHERLASRVQFAWRMLWHASASGLVVLFSLGLGMGGYSYYEGLGWRDAFLNAAMLLGGMGPVTMPTTPGGKLFAGLYALYAGLVFLVATGIVLGPVLHRLLHHFHWDEEGGQDGG
jgi:hypothetical protein